MLFMVAIPAIGNRSETGDWATTSGKITLSRGTMDLERHPITSRLTRYYRADVRYEYQVDTKKYESRSVTLNSSQINYPTRGLADSAARKYPSGQTVTVFYDPDQPHRSVLEQGDSLTNYLPLIFSILLILLAFVFASGSGLWIFFRVRSGQGWGAVLGFVEPKPQASDTDESAQNEPLAGNPGSSNLRN